MKRIVLVCAMSIALFGQGRTVAFWPLEASSSGTADFTCRVDSRNDLQGSGCTSLASDCAGKGLPPNADPWVPDDFLQNAGCCTNSTPDSKNPVLHNVFAGRYVAATNSYTVEGWFRLSSLPSLGGDNFFIIFGGHQSVSSLRWHASLRTNKSTGCYRWNLYGAYETAKNDAYGPDIPAATMAGEVGVWHHAAVTWDNDIDANLGVFTLYVDSVPVVTYTNTAVTAFGAGEQSFSVGGRSSDSSRRFNGSFDCLRISDVALRPVEFLNAGTGWRTTSATTVGYWKLDSFDGACDLSSAVGGRPFQLGVNAESPHFSDAALNNVHAAPTRDMAFSGYAHNATMEPAVSLDMPNDGSVVFPFETQRVLIDKGLGKLVTLTNDFTVEGWIRPSGYEGREIQNIFASSASSNARWQFSLRQDGQKWKLIVFAHDNSKQVISATLSSSLDMEEWTAKWWHVALTYDWNGGANGRGEWTLYLDGERQLAAENAAAPKVGYPVSEVFNLGGRWGADLTYAGKLDSVRVCKTVLSPAQFLNAEAGASKATNVLAYWPLNTQDGRAVDGRDATGQRTALATVWSDDQLPMACADHPVISNPDQSPCFIGGSSMLSGSVRFYDSTDASGKTNPKASLLTLDPLVLALANSFSPMTIEFYYKPIGQPRQKSASAHYSLLYAFAKNVKASGSDWNLDLRYDSSAGFKIKDTLTGSLSDGVACGDTGVYALGTWHHVAVTREVADGKSYVRFYHDGVLKQTLSSNARTSVDTTTAFLLGGSWSYEWISLNGAMSSLRVSNRVLKTDEFLNAAPVRPVESLTNSVWTAKSVSLPTTIPGYGTYAAMGSSFTLEAKVRIPVDQVSDVELFGCSRAGSSAANWTGWRLSLGADGNLSVTGRLSTRFAHYVNGTVGSLAAYAGQSVYLALEHDSTVGDGLWRVFVNGQLAGQLANTLNPSQTMGDVSVQNDVYALDIGAGFAEGRHANCRLVRTALTADLLQKAKGTVLIFR